MYYLIKKMNLITKTTSLKNTLALFLIVFPLIVVCDEKLPEDPTKIVTKLGFSYTDEPSLSGSIGLDETRKINARINEDASEWRLGGSWLFKKGIVNFNFSESEFDTGASQTSYSVGTFIPLSIFGITPGGWQIFPMGGYSYNDGEIISDNLNSDVEFDYVLVPATSHGIYLGAFGLKPLSEQWTLIGFGGGSVGSDDYSGYWAGAGIGYRINGNHSVNLFGVYSDNSFGQDDKVGVSYTYEFN